MEPEQDVIFDPAAEEIARLVAENKRLREALEEAVAAMAHQVGVCHAREAAFRDTNIFARPMDWQEVAMNMYAATAEPLAHARVALEQSSGG
jgi:hypothetical protein